MIFTASHSVTAASITPSTTQAGGGGNDETQRLTIVANKGTYTVTFDANTSDPIPVPADNEAPTLTAYNATVKAALEANASIDSVTAVTAATATGWTVDITFGGTQADTDVAQVTASATGLINSVLIATGQGAYSELHVVSGDAILIGGQADNCLYSVEDRPTTLELFAGEEVWANGATGSVTTLLQGASVTPA